ncbi:hypothetical protein PF004_g18373 [Phytophthora fragariae]|uniref:ADF-H domain-containing protein n=2 Tax=Phytophthora fragariae TaxID=53985 RepID=A0A6G0NCP5_9STRA|nr:hypothetical protein PF004_g18373 [Phytophthora fragariae]
MWRRRCSMSFLLPCDCVLRRVAVVSAGRTSRREAMNALSSDLQDFKAIEQQDAAELSKSMREGCLSVDRSDDSE